jgi:hypothetical protein
MDRLIAGFEIGGKIVIADGGNFSEPTGAAVVCAREKSFFDSLPVEVSLTLL